MVPTPAAELAEMAADCLGFERAGPFRKDAARAVTRDMLTDRARELGIPAAEIEAAVNAAIGGAEVTA